MKFQLQTNSQLSIFSCFFQHAGPAADGIVSKIYTYEVPIFPSITIGSKMCLPIGVIGVAVNGIPIHNHLAPSDCCNSGKERSSLKIIYSNEPENEIFCFLLGRRCLHLRNCLFSVKTAVTHSFCLPTNVNESNDKVIR